MTYIINCGLANIAWNKLTAKVTAISKLLHSSCTNGLFFMTANVLHFTTSCGQGKSTLLVQFHCVYDHCNKKGERKGETSANLNNNSIKPNDSQAKLSEISPNKLD